MRTYSESQKQISNNGCPDFPDFSKNGCPDFPDFFLISIGGFGNVRSDRNPGFKTFGFAGGL
jgi:hypothetical protein